MSHFGCNLWVRSVGVPLQVLGGCKLGLTETAAVGSLPCVNTHVFFKVTGLCETPLALVTTVRLDAQVALNVHFQTGLGGKLASTALTLVQLQLEMSADVLPHVAGGCELGWAEGASIWPLASVCADVKLE